MDNPVNTADLANDVDRRLQDFVDASSDWFWEMDEQCRFSYFSERFTEITGVPQEALLGKTRQETGIPNVDPVAWKQHLADLAARRPFRNFVHPRSRSDGKTQHLSINGKPIFDDAGNFRGYRGTGTDVTKQMVAEQARMESSAIYERASRLAKLGHWEWDEIEDRGIYCSDELARIHGSTPEHYLAQTQSTEGDLQRIHPDDRENYRQIVEKSITDQVGFNADYRIVRPDGDVVHVRESSEAIFNDDGKFIRSVGFIQDVTALKHAQLELDEKSDQLERATQIAQLGHWGFDEKTLRYTYVSDQYARIFGYTVDEFMQNRSQYDQELSLIHPDDRDRIRHEYKNNNKTDLEYRIIRADGAVRYVREIIDELENRPDDAFKTAGTLQDITELVEAREALKKSNSELETRVVKRTAEITELYESLRQKESHLLQSQKLSRMGGFVWDEVNDRPEQISQEFADLFKITIEQTHQLFASRQHAENLIVPEDREAYRETLKSSRINKASYDVVYRSLDTGGRMHYWRETGEPVFDEDGQLIRTFGSLQNITKFKFTEATLKESETLLHQAHRISKTGYWMAGTDEKLKVSSEMARLLHMPREELDGITTAEFVERVVHKDDRQWLFEFYDKTDDREQFEVEYRVSTLNDETIWIHETGEWIENEATGKKVEIGTLQDITAHKLIEENLRVSERRFRSLIENLPSGIVLESENKEIILANSRIQHWCRSAESDIVGKTVSEIFPVSIAEQINESNKIIIASNAPHRFEFNWTIGDVERNFVAIKFPIPVSDGATTMGIIISDVSEQRRTTAQLQRSQKMEAVGQLTGGVAHDFNNLLAVILGSTELLSSSVAKEDRKAQKLLNSIIHSSTRGAELTQRLLSFSRQLPLHASEIDTGELLRGLKDMVSRSLGELYNVEFTIDPDTWQVTADAGQLENAILNLAINAGHAMPKGGKLHIESYNTTIDADSAMKRDEVQPGDYIVIMVSDTGTGMSSEVMAKAIEPFFTTKEIGEGSGLGLSMVYGFAKQSGGDMTIYSELGHGTTIRIYLPRSKIDEEKLANNRAESKPIPGHETIFVIEDNEDVRDMVEIMLEDLGYKVILSEHAEAAYRVLESGEHFDLLLSDVVLPGGTSGPEFVNKIKDDYPGLKVLFMTGYAESMKYEYNSDNEEFELISKPFRKQEIADRLRNIFDS